MKEMGLDPKWINDCRVWSKSKSLLI
jgi:hypothetical protein